MSPCDVATASSPRAINPGLTPTAPMDSFPNPPPLVPTTPKPAQISKRISPQTIQDLRAAVNPGCNHLGASSSKLNAASLSFEDLPAEIYEYSDSAFRIHATVFNGSVATSAYVLVRPRNARQVSRLVLFCRAHGLEISVKSGGYGTHGWSVAGNVVVDLSLMSGATIDFPESASAEGRTIPKLRYDRTSSVVRQSTHGFGNNAQETDLKGKGKERMDPIITHRPTPTSSDSHPPSSEDEVAVRPRLSPSKRAISYKRTADTAWEDAGGCARRRGSLATSSLQDSGPPPPKTLRSNADAGPVLDEDQKRMMMDGLGADLPESTTSVWTSGHYPTSSALGVFTPGIDLNPPFSAANFSLNAGYGMDTQRWTFGQALNGGGDPRLACTTARPSRSTASSASSSGGRPSIASSHRSSSYGSHPNHGLVTFGAGATSKAIDKVTSKSRYGPYHIPMSAFPVGSAIMMTGGFGFLSREYGLSMDNLVEVEMVLADGRIVWLGSADQHGNGECLGLENADGTEGSLSEDEARDLWWAVRGAGPALGIATRYRAKAYHVPVVYSGNIIYPFNPLTAPSLIKHVRDCVKGSPRAMYANVILTAGPSTIAGVVIVQLCFTGVREKGQELMEAISSWPEERSLFKDIEERSFIEQQDSIANVLKGGAGRKWFIKSDLLTSLTDEVAWKTCQQFHTVPDGCTWLFEFTGGAVVDTKTTCLPQSHREAAYTVAALHQWPIDTPDEDVRCITTARDWIDKVIHPQSPGGPLPCFLQTSNLEVVKGTYGDNFDKLCQIKEQFDPSNLFRHTLWPSLVDKQINGAHKVNGSVPAETQTNGSAECRQLAQEDSRLGQDGIQGLVEGASNVVGQVVVGVDPALKDSGLQTEKRNQAEANGGAAMQSAAPKARDMGVTV